MDLDVGNSGRLQVRGFYPAAVSINRSKAISEILARPLIFIALREHPLGFEGEVNTKNYLFYKYSFPTFLLRELESSRLVGYIEGKDRYDESRVVVVFYDKEDNLCFIEVQGGIPTSKKILAREGSGDDIILSTLFENGLVQIQPAGAFVPDNSL